MTTCPPDQEFEKNDALNALASLIDDGDKINEHGDDQIGGADSKTDAKCPSLQHPCHEPKDMDDNDDTADNSELVLSNEVRICTHPQQSRPLVPSAQRSRSRDNSRQRKHGRELNDSRHSRRPCPFSDSRIVGHGGPLRAEAANEVRSQKRLRPTLGQVQIRLALTGLL
jgi:hypothetical protein